MTTFATSIFCWGTRTRTKNDRTRICSVTEVYLEMGTICSHDFVFSQEIVVFLHGLIY